MMQVPLDFARALGDAGMAKTLKVERELWRERALQELRVYALYHCGGAGFRTEDFREWYRAAGHEPPHDHHVWGALTDLARRRGLIRATGRYVPSESEKTHGHRVLQWEAA